MGRRALREAGSCSIVVVVDDLGSLSSLSYNMHHSSCDSTKFMSRFRQWEASLAWRHQGT